MKSNFITRLSLNFGASKSIAAASFGALSLGIVSLFSSTTLADDRFAKVEIEPQQVAHTVYMMTGYGGNIGVSAGPDGILIVDDQFAELADKIALALKEIVSTDLRYVINTHYHGDHTGSNAEMKHRHDATIVAHDNVRVRLHSNPEIMPAALPVITYEQGVKFHFNGETIHVRHLPKAHTDGDSYVLFEEQNVLHTGDLMFNKLFPYVDLNGGGTVTGYISAIEAMLSVIDEQTQIIPGHGPLASKQDLESSLAMIKATNAIVQKHKQDGKSLDSIIEQGLGEEYTSWAWSFISEEKWITTLYNSK